MLMATLNFFFPVGSFLGRAECSLFYINDYCIYIYISYINILNHFLNLRLSVI